MYYDYCSDCRFSTAGICFFGLTDVLDFVDPHSSYGHTFTQNGWLDENGLRFTICKLHIHLCTVLKVINLVTSSDYALCFVV